MFPSQHVDPSQESPTAWRTADLVADLLARMLRAVFVHTTLEMELDAADVTSFARQLSLGMVGVIILTSVRRVLRGVTRVRSFPACFQNFSLSHKR